MRYLTIPKEILILNMDTESPYKKVDPKSTQPTPEQIAAGAQPILVDDIETYTYSIWRWGKTFCFRDKKFGAEGWETWARVARIAESLKEIEAGSVIMLEEDDWKLWVEVATHPTEMPYSDNLIAMQFAPFIRALVGASETKPEAQAA